MKNSLAEDSGIDLEEQEEDLNESSCFIASTKNDVEKEENQRILRAEYNEMKMAGEKIYSIGRKRVTRGSVWSALRSYRRYCRQRGEQEEAKCQNQGIEDGKG